MDTAGERKVTLLDYTFQETFCECETSINRICDHGVNITATLTVYYLMTDYLIFSSEEHN